VPTIQFAVACHECGTSLASLDSAGVCASCGRRIAETVDDRILDLETGMVAVDLTCATCAYNLRTMHHDAVCPECGTPVAHSLRVDELRFCDPSWLRRIRKGLTLAVLSVLVSIALAALVGIFTAVTALRASGSVAVPGASVMLIIGFSMSVLPLWSLFCITSPKPDEAPDDRTNRIGRWSRNLVVAALVVSLGGLLFYDPSQFMTPRTVDGRSMIPGTISTVLWFGAAIGTMVCLGRIAILGRRPGLRKLTRILCWLLGAQTVISLVSSVFALMAMPAIAASMPGGPMGMRTSTPVLPGGTGVTIRTGTSQSTLSSTPAPAGSTATVPPAMSGTSPAVAPGAAPPFPTRGFGALIVIGCASSLVSISLFILGLIAISKYRTLLTSAIASSVSASPTQPSTAPGTLLQP